MQRMLQCRILINIEEQPTQLVDSMTHVKTPAPICFHKTHIPVTSIFMLPCEVMALFDLPAYGTRYCSRLNHIWHIADDVPQRGSKADTVSPPPPTHTTCRYYLEDNHSQSFGSKVLKL